jgi:aspartate 1-decarboxylase
MSSCCRTPAASTGVLISELEKRKMRMMLTAKLHRVRLTRVDRDYEGSVAIDRLLLDEAGILEYEMVHIWNVTNGERLETYAIAAPAGSGEICLNGAAAHRGNPDDIVIIAAFAPMEETQARIHRPTVVYVDHHNRSRRAIEGNLAHPAATGARPF